MENRQRYKTSASQADGGSRSRGINPHQKLLSFALKLLSLRPHSCYEIVHRLETKTSDTESITSVIDWLKNNRFLDDHQFASWMVTSYSRTKPKGKFLLSRLLKQKGISPEIITSVLADTTDETASAVVLLRKKQSLWRSLSYRDYRLKAGRLLSSRGFGWDTIERVVKKEYNDNHVK